MSLRYKAPSDISKSEFLEIVSGNATTTLCQAIVDAVHSIPDYGWLLGEFKGLLEHQNEQVRDVTATCVGHLARLNSDAKKEQLLSILQPHLSDSLIAGVVEDAIDDIHTFAR